MSFLRIVGILQLLSAMTIAFLGVGAVEMTKDYMKKEIVKAEVRGKQEGTASAYKDLPLRALTEINI